MNGNQPSYRERSTLNKRNVVLQKDADIIVDIQCAARDWSLTTVLIDLTDLKRLDNGIDASRYSIEEILVTTYATPSQSPSKYLRRSLYYQAFHWLSVMIVKTPALGKQKLYSFSLTRLTLLILPTNLLLMIASENLLINLLKLTEGYCVDDEQ